MRKRMKKVSALLAALVLAGTVILGTSGRVEAAETNYPKTVEDTELKWSQTIGVEGFNNPTQVLELGNYLYIVGSGNVYKLDPKDGSVVDKKSGISNSWNVFLTSNGMDTLYIQAAMGSVYAVNTSDLSVKWEVTKSDANWSGFSNSPLTYANGVVYGDNSGKTNSFFAIDATTGLLKWSKSDSTKGSNNSAPFVIGNHVVFGSNDGKLYSYNIDGTLVGEPKAVGAGIYSSIKYDNGFLYYVDKTAKLHKTAFDAATGLIGEDSSTEIGDADASTTTPAIKDGKIFVGGSVKFNDGKVAVFDMDLNLIDQKTVTGLGKTYNLHPVTDPTDTSNTLIYTEYYYNKANQTGGELALSFKNNKLTEAVDFGSLTASTLAGNFSYSDAQLTVGYDGTLYYSNDSGKLVALSAKKTVVPVPATDLTPVPSTTTEKTPVQVVDLSQGNTVLDAQSFTTILEENKTKDIVVKSDNNITFTFAKGSMKAVDGKTEYDFGTKIVEKYTKDLPSYISKNDFVKRINFNYSGELPGTALIKIPVGKEYVGQTLYYSLLKEGTQFAEAQAVTVDADGYITVSQSHCSDWVVTTNGPEQTSAKSPKTSDVNTVLPILVFVAAAAVLVVSTKKQA